MTQWVATGLSILFEAPWVVGIGRASGWGVQPSYSRLIMSAVIVTLLSHPVAWASMVTLIPKLGYWPAVGLVEVGVVLFEGSLYRMLLKMSWGRSMGMSLVANTTSVVGGLLIYAAEGRF